MPEKEDENNEESKEDAMQKRSEQQSEELRDDDAHPSHVGEWRERQTEDQRLQPTQRVRKDQWEVSECGHAELNRWVYFVMFGRPHHFRSPGVYHCCLYREIARGHHYACASHRT